MNETTKQQYSYIVAIFPLILAGAQVLFGSASLVLLWFGAGMCVVSFLLSRFLAGLRLFGGGQVRFGRRAALRIWQAPAIWVPVIVTVGMLAFYGFALL